MVIWDYPISVNWEHDKSWIENMEVQYVDFATEKKSHGHCVNKQRSKNDFKSC